MTDKAQTDLIGLLDEMERMVEESPSDLKLENTRLRVANAALEQRAKNAETIAQGLRALLQSPFLPPPPKSVA